MVAILDSKPRIDLRTKPLVSVALSDADPRSSVSFVQQKLRDADIQVDFTPEQIAYIERLGGRASELNSVNRFIYGLAASDRMSPSAHPQSS